MRKLAVVFCAIAFVGGARASWYWPFGSDDDGSEPLRISELMEPVTQLIDEASDLAADGKVNESVEKYRAVLEELDRIERENPERAKGPEFATLRNKRAYVNAAIDGMLLRQVKQNARSVAVSDTTELEKKLAEERAGKKAKEKGEGERREKVSVVQHKPSPRPSPRPPKPVTKRDQAIDAIARGDYAAAAALIDEMLAAKPNGAMALNLRAAMEMKQGKLDAAERTLDQAITSNPRNHFAYYNLALLMMQKDAGNKASAKRYYETGRAMGGPENAELEALLK